MLNERDLAHPLAGGVEVHLEEVATRLVRDHGFEITVLCAGFEGGPTEEERGGVRYLRSGDRGFSYYAQLPGRARREVVGGGYDLVVENLCKLLFFSPLYLPGIPKLGLVHHLFGLSAFRQVAAPIAAYVVATEALLPIAYRRWPLVVVSPSTRDDLVRRGLPRRRIVVIPNGLDEARFRPGLPEREEDLVLFVGRLEYYKGVDDLLRAWPGVRAIRPAARLVLVGAGTAEESLRRAASEAGCEGSVSFEGFVPEEEKIAWMRRASLVVQPSHKEGWGLTVLEANACGAPVVATDVPGLRDSVRHGETGLLVRGGEPSALTRGIVELLDDGELRERLGAGGLGWSRRFRWDAVADAFARVARAAARREPMPEVPDFLSGGEAA